MIFKLILTAIRPLICLIFLIGPVSHYSATASISVQSTVHQTGSLFGQPVAVNEYNLRLAKGFVGMLEAKGGTEILPALRTVSQVNPGSVSG